ncbi:MAG: hypothetical protein ACRYHA_18080 [Janthinobacterium lividum]
MDSHRQRRLREPVVQGSRIRLRVFAHPAQVRALAGSAGYYVGSWLILHRPAYDAWAVFGGVGALGWVLARVLLPSGNVPMPAVQ